MDKQAQNRFLFRARIQFANLFAVIRVKSHIFQYDVKMEL